MKLYAIKVIDHYLRIKAGFQLVGLDKASVYPLEKYPYLEEQLALAKSQGMTQARIVEMVITEKEDD